MNGTSHATPTLANSGGNRATPKSAEQTPIQQILIEFFRSFPNVKPWAKVAEILGLTNDSAKNRIKGIRGFSPEEIVVLLRSDYGGEFLDKVMAGARPKWWRDVRRQIELSELRKRQEAQRALIERLEREAAE